MFYFNFHVSNSTIKYLVCMQSSINCSITQPTSDEWQRLLNQIFVMSIVFSLVAKLLYNKKCLSWYPSVCQLRLEGNVIFSAANQDRFFFCAHSSHKWVILSIYSKNILSFGLSVRLQNAWMYKYRNVNFSAAFKIEVWNKGKRLR